MSTNLIAPAREFEPVRLYTTVVAVLTAALAIGFFTDRIGSEAAGWLGFGLVILQVAWGSYTRGQVTPNGNVAAFTATSDTTGAPVLLAGPAVRDITDGAPVDVLPADYTDGPA